MPRLPPTARKILSGLAISFASAVLLSACATQSKVSTMRSPDFSSLSQAEVLSTLDQLAARYKSNPRDKVIIVHYAAALRAANQAPQAVAVLERGMEHFRGDADISIAYAKALSAQGRFDQALNVIEAAIQPDQPDWNALSVKGVILDQMGRNSEARLIYSQALTIAPGEASLEANLGLSFAMTNDLGDAEEHLRLAVQMRGVTSQIRQNLALVVGLQGRFEEARAIFAAELSPEQVESNMAYIRALLTQQNRWQAIEESN